ncbi:MAG: hypothetical protein A2X48_21165 [Lentisphaerae bacterium GWF2_49_21]|nr:MAG: hypothetical protein A2X48_21165 [Lentisphaerae bacterium GWF2_49_21]
MKQSLSQTAYDYVLEKIISGEIAPGTILNRRSVAKELKMSPAPVLEAMVRLQSDGFLNTIQRKGTIVCGTSREDIRSYMILREAIECQAVRICHGKAIKENEVELKKIAAKFNLPSKTTIDKFHLESEFHSRLVSLAGSVKISEFFDKAMKLILYYKINRFHDKADANEYSDHVKLVDLLKTADPDKAEKYIRLHLNSDFYV